MTKFTEAFTLAQTQNHVFGLNHPLKVTSAVFYELWACCRLQLWRRTFSPPVFAAVLVVALCHSKHLLTLRAVQYKFFRLIFIFFDSKADHCLHSDLLQSSVLTTDYMLL